jgi:cytochrome P450
MKIDLLSPASFAGGQPHGQYDWLREHAPVRWHEEPEGPGPGRRGFWAVTRHADVWAVDRDFQTYSSEPTIMITDPLAEAGSFGPYKMMLMMDPPEHTGFRKLIRSEFTEPAARLRQGRIQELAKQIVDAVIERGECDFVAEVAGEMPSFVIAGGQAVMKMFEYGGRVIAEKRARPGDDLASRLLACEVDGRKLEDMEFLLFFLLLVDAGGDTTRNLLSGGLLALMEHPEQYAWLMADLEARLPTAREELLRWTSPVIYMRRTAKRDTELGGQTIREGDKVVMYFGAANRDPAAFDRPEVLDLSRTDNPHIAFGTGPHGCLGQHIARIEIDAMLREVLTRMTDFGLAAPVEWLASNFISGPKAMPLRFRAA